MNWKTLSEQVLGGHDITADEAVAILRAPDEEILSLVDAAYSIRKTYYDNGISVHVLKNAKSGMCKENCKFCSQAIGAYSGVDRYQIQEVDELVAGAYAAHARNAAKYCMVTATRGPGPKEMETICSAVKQIKEKLDIDICVSLGLLTVEQSKTLAEAGVDRVNHNLETSERYFSEVCNTHTFNDRLQTVKNVKEAGMEACCGGIMGMGETEEDRVDMALTLRELGVESIPVNFMDPRPGTPLGDVPRLSPIECLKSLCMFRFANPTRDIRAAGGREVCLKHMQPFCLYIANSIFTEGYLTTPGQGENEDILMIEEAGFYITDFHEGEQLDGKKKEACSSKESEPVAAAE